ncbi:MAG: 3-deoxy-D-manno-octulosonic acid transferase [Candidatus Omnitrophota bacterium]|nr:3-deoxy-D-manno-octulosonic acid transferase [Candidatus Omnitrophota bacterium]
MLYSIGFFIFSLLYLPTLIFKGKLHADFGERFAIFDKMKERALLSGRDRIWIQAVSVGEVALCKSFIPVLKEKFPDRDIVISTITKAGNDLARKIFGKDVVIIYFPLDFKAIVRKTISLIKPALYIMIETEIWPNLLAELSSRAISSALINGRISDRSIGKYRFAKPFLKKTLESINIFCMQDSIDAERIIELGAPKERVRITGNMKFDIELPANVKDIEAVRDLFGLKAGEELFVAGSTREGEEEIVLDVFNRLLADFPNLRLLIAPRHIDRAVQIDKLIQTLTPDSKSRIILLDTIGHLNEAYSVATIVFVGGSLIKHGGHNPIEPAYFAKPILFGLNMFNFKYIAAVFLRNKAALQVFNGEDLYEKCKLLLRDAAARGLLGKNAKKTIVENAGATGKNVIEIAGVLK